MLYENSNGINLRTAGNEQLEKEADILACIKHRLNFHHQSHKNGLS